MTQYNNESNIRNNRKSGESGRKRLAGTARKRLAGGVRRILTAALLLLALLFQAGCGEKLDTGFRVLEVIGTRRYSVICRKDDRIAPMIDEAMQHLAYTGHLGSLCVRWLGRDQITLAGHPPSAQTTQEPGGGTQEQRTLIVGLETDFFPMAYTSDSGLSGLTVDIANALGTELGWEVRIQSITPAEVGTQLSSGNIDCALGFDPSSVKEEAYSVGVSYLDSDIVLAVRQESEITRVKDIRGERIGTVDDPSVTKAVQGSENISKYASGATVYLSSRRCVSAMDNGWCAAVAMDIIMLEYANR